MDNQPVQGNTPSNPRRKRRTKMQIFKEAYLPFITLAVATLLIIGLVVGIVSCTKKDPDPTEPTGSAPNTQLQMEVDALLEEAKALALAYEYDAALQLLQQFNGDVSQFPLLQSAIYEYTAITHNMVSWTANEVPNLSFHVLLTDLTSALKDPTYGESGNNRYNKNFVTIGEFSTILRRLYENGYVLVSLSDLFSYSEQNGKYVYSEKTLMLPEGKKPILLTETHCNYYTYMIDSTGDGLADAGGAGFASKLCWDNDFYNELVTTNGSVVTGAYDLVPILENFIKLHPDFSYKGARAILAFSGYDGIFGYRVTSDDLSGDALAKEQADATVLVNALKEAGYTIACYTYGNIDYSVKSAQAVKTDIEAWQNYIAPIVGQTDILVFAQDSDIGTSYENNEKFDILYAHGYRFFLGSTPFLSCEIQDAYVRHNRLMVTGSTLYHHPETFSQFFSLKDLLDLRRNNIPA